MGEGNVLTRVCPSVCPGGGVPVSHNALQHFPECHGAAGGGGTLPGPARGGVPCKVQPGGGTLPGPAGGGVPWPGGGTLPGPAGGGVLCQVQPEGGGTLAGGGYPVRTT